MRHSSKGFDPQEAFALRETKPEKQKGPLANSYRTDQGKLCLYAIGSEEHNYIKVGVSVTPYVRLSDLQSASPFPLMMMCFVEGNREGIQSMERVVHNRLRGAGYAASGEWSSFAEAGITPLFLTVADAIGVKLDKVVGDTSLGFVDDSKTRQRLDSTMMPCKGQKPGRRR